jgi:hypothetical protein
MSRIATVVLSSDNSSTNAKKIKDLNEIVDSTDADVFILPGGHFSAGQKRASTLYKSLASKIHAPNSIVCMGVDGYNQKPWPRDQTAIAISNSEVISAARKFYSAPTEENIILSQFGDDEKGLPRTFSCENKNYFLTVCYDSFGIRHKNLKNPGVEAIINHIHGFFPAGQPNSGESYFARHGLAGASKQWSVPIFASATFFDRPIPKNWPSGVSWDSGEESTLNWGYSKNAIGPESEKHVQLSSGEARVLIYNATI